MLIANCDDSVPRFTFFILHDNETEIIRGIQSAKRDIFYDRVVFAVACSAASVCRGRPRNRHSRIESIAHRPHRHVHSTVDPSKTHGQSTMTKLRVAGVHASGGAAGATPPRRQECATAVRSISRDVRRGHSRRQHALRRCAIPARAQARQSYRKPLPYPWCVAFLRSAIHCDHL